MTTPAAGLHQIDPMTFEVLRNAFMSVVDEMGLMLERVGHSLVVSEGRDFSAAICDADGRMVAEGKEDLPAHVGTLPHTVKGVISWVGKEAIHEGDIFIMNDAFVGGTHCQDVRTIMPVFRDGELIAFVQNSAHWSDAGGPVPGSFHAEAASTYGEALYIPPIHLVREGELDDEVLRFILRNVRVPETTQGDVFAQVAACRTGEARLQAMIDKYGTELLLAEMEELMRYSEALLREEFRRIPDGTYTFADAIDFDPMGDRKTPVAIRIAITIEGDRATYDLSGSDPQAIGAINSTRSMAQSALVVATKAIFPHVPASEGIYNAIDVVNPEGLVTNAQFPRPISGAFATSYEVITACVFGCYLQMLPERSMACSGNMTNMVVGGLRSPARLRARLRHVHLERGRLRRPAGKEGQPHRDQPLRLRDAQRAGRGPGARVPDHHPPLRVHRRLARRRPAPRRYGRHARLRAHPRRRDAVRARQPRGRARVGMGGRAPGARKRPDLRRGRAGRVGDRRDAIGRRGPARAPSSASGKAAAAVGRIR